MAVRFYNPGSRISETLPFDHPTNQAKDLNTISYWRIEAPEKGFFDVPTQVTVPSDSGEELTVPVNFPRRVQEVYRSWGVVRIDPRAKDISPEENVARSEKEAKEKGEELYKEILMAKAREHIAQVELIRGQGMPPARATGIYKLALKTLGIADPADQVGNVVAANQNVAQITTLEEKIARLEKLLEGKPR